MRTKFLLLTILVFAINFKLDAKSCSCGTYENGQYDYTVDDGTGCCTGRVHQKAYLTKFVYDEGAWEVSSVTEVTGSTAQNRCCPAV